MRQPRRSSSRRFSRTSEFIGASTVCDILYATYCIAHSIVRQEEFLLPEEKRRNTEEFGAGGGSRTLTGFLSPADFLTAYGFRRPELLFIATSGLRSGLSLHRTLDVSRLRCCPSSLYTFPAGLLRAWLGIATLRRFPRIWAVLHRQFPGEHSSFSQVRCVCHSATPAWRSDCPSIIGQVFPELRVRFFDPQSALSVAKLPWSSHLRMFFSFSRPPDRDGNGVERR